MCVKAAVAKSSSPTRGKPALRTYSEATQPSLPTSTHTQPDIHPIPHTTKMSVETHAINPEAFAEAIADLPLSAVYSKVSELRNSIAHLHRSNEELRLFLTESKDSEAEKKELEGYVLENEGVVTSMNERISLLKVEVERRGQTWIEEKAEEKDLSGEAQVSEATAVPVSNGSAGAGLGDQGSNANAGQEEDGVYL